MTIDGPLATKGHLALAAVEGVMGFGLLSPWVSGWFLPSAAALYLGLGLGATYFLVAKGPVECGCWGAATSKIRPRLIGLDLALAAIALGLHLTSATTLPAKTITLLFALGVTCLVFAFSVALPEARWAYLGLKARAKRHIRWLRDFPDLPNIPAETLIQ